MLFCVLILSLKAGEDDNLLEINKKIAGRVSFVFFLAASFLWIFAHLMFFRNLHSHSKNLLVRTSTDRLKHHSDLSGKRVQWRWSKWNWLTYLVNFRVVPTPSLLSKSVHDVPFPWMLFLCKVISDSHECLCHLNFVRHHIFSYMTNPWFPNWFSYSFGPFFFLTS